MDFINRRIQILAEYCRNYNKYARYVKPWEIVFMLLDLPLSLRSNLFIENIIEDEHSDCLRIKLRGINRQLYWPKSCEQRMLYQFVSEVFNRFDWHHYEIPETRVEEGDVVLDCGASEGLFGLKNYTKAQTIYLIEPLKIFYEALQKTFRGIDSVTILRYALSESASDTFSLGDDALFSGAEKDTGGIEVTTIDALFHEKNIPVSFIKADVEGHEMALLKGARETIKRNFPKIAITCYHDGNDWEEMSEFVRSIHPEYEARIKGIYHVNKKPIMLHMWAPLHLLQHWREKRRK